MYFSNLDAMMLMIDSEGVGEKKNKLYIKEGHYFYSIMRTNRSHSFFYNTLVNPRGFRAICYVTPLQSKSRARVFLFTVHPSPYA